MAAKRYGISTVLIPKDNVRDLEEIDQTVRAALRFVPVETVDQVSGRGAVPEQMAGSEGGAAAGLRAGMRERRETRRCASEGEVMSLNFQKAEFVRFAGQPKHFLRDGAAPVCLCGAIQRGQVLGDQPAVAAEELWPVLGRLPGKTTHINYFRIDRAGCTWWICRATAMPRCQQGGKGALGPADGDLFPA